MFLTSANLNGVTHGFFGRKGGVSGDVYASLNCGLGSNDTKEHIRENRSRAVAALGASPESLCTLYQIHSNKVAMVEKPWADTAMPKADALVTNRKGITLGILTADCVPVLFADIEAGVIGAAHAGWRGALAGVVAATVEAMEAFGANPANIRAAVGPAIAQGSYEVGIDLRGAFVEKNPEYEAFFTPAMRGNHWMFDIKGFVQKRLGAARIENIEVLEGDTCLEEETFFSYRRATRRSEADYGRQISAITLK